jgi:hypothetical protein
MYMTKKQKEDEGGTKSTYIPKVPNLADLPPQKKKKKINSINLQTHLIRDTHLGCYILLRPHPKSNTFTCNKLTQYVQSNTIAGLRL